MAADHAARTKAALPVPSYAGQHRSFDKRAFLESIRATGLSPSSPQLAAWLDAQDPLRGMRDDYVLPQSTRPGPSKPPTSNGAADGDEEAEPRAIYLCGNSLGPLPRRTKRAIEQELDAWGQKGVLGHWDHPYDRPWTKQEERVGRLMSDIVGAKPSEVTAMSTLTQNLLSMLATFYRPHAVSLKGLSPATTSASTAKPRRYKILYEARAFPSDQYALASAVALAGFDPNDALVPLRPRAGERTLRTDDILRAIATDDSLYMVMFGGVQYLTGQLFEIERITRAARAKGLIVGWDLAHAFANVPLALHDWDVDFAVWCTYKYGSSGPGGIAGAFVHERWGDVGMRTDLGACTGTHAVESGKGVEGLLRPAGWWGQRRETRFSMPDSFDAIRGAAGWQVSNPSMLDVASLLGSLETLAQAPHLVDATLERVDLGSVEWAERVESATADAVDSGAVRARGAKGKVGEGLIMPALRCKSQRLTAYLEMLLLEPGVLPELPAGSDRIQVVTPEDPQQRGSQLCVRIPDVPLPTPTSTSAPASANGAPNGKPAASATKGDAADEAEGGRGVPPPVSTATLLSRAHRRAERLGGLVADVRNPDLLRLAPLAQFSSFEDVRRGVEALAEALAHEIGPRATP